MLKWYDYIYLRPSLAVALGFTHHGTLYGVPAYLAEKDDNENMACPKLPILQLYAIAMDYCFAFLANFLPEDQVVDTPMTFGKPLDEHP